MTLNDKLDRSFWSIEVAARLGLPPRCEFRVTILGDECRMDIYDYETDQTYTPTEDVLTGKNMLDIINEVRVDRNMEPIE